MNSPDNPVLFDGLGDDKPTVFPAAEWPPAPAVADFNVRVVPSPASEGWFPAGGCLGENIPDPHAPAGTPLAPPAYAGLPIIDVAGNVNKFASVVRSQEAVSSIRWDGPADHFPLYEGRWRG